MLVVAVSDSNGTDKLGDEVEVYILWISIKPQDSLSDV
jgi:hypothetical protein